MLVSPYLRSAVRPLHRACDELHARRGRPKPCDDCTLSDRCACERAGLAAARPAPETLHRK